jgi:hypothetical protein
MHDHSNEWVRDLRPHTIPNWLPDQEDMVIRAARLLLDIEDQLDRERQAKRLAPNAKRLDLAAGSLRGDTREGH